MIRDFKRVPINLTQKQLDAVEVAMVIGMSWSAAILQVAGDDQPAETRRELERRVKDKERAAHLRTIELAFEDWEKAWSKAT